MLFVINVGWQRKKHKFTVQMMRAPYEIGEEIRGMLLKILQTKRNKMGRKKRPYIHQLCRNMINPYSTML
jgi:hypothetical protein